MEIFAVGIIIFLISSYNKVFDTDKFIKDNDVYFKLLMESDYEFYVRAKYGENADTNLLFNKRIKLFAITLVAWTFIFVSNFSFINVGLGIIVSYFVYKSGYSNVRSYYKKQLFKIDEYLPHYLKTIEILSQHYTVPVTLARSLDDAPEIFKPGLKEMIARIDAGDSSIEPYMDFAKAYPVRDSMRMMRLLYRLSLGSNENKDEQLLMFSKSVSSLQNKAREVKYKSRLSSMEKRTLIMLVVTGGGTMVILLISMFMLFTGTSSIG